MKLFCIPFAGGMASAYNEWKILISEEITIIPIELQGRGKRFGEKMYESFEEIVEDVYKCIRDNVTTDEEYGIFGHSMGAVIAYDLFYYIEQIGMKKPCLLCLSGIGMMKEKPQRMAQKQDDDFIDSIFQLGGIPKEIIENDILKQLFIPIVKNDVYLLENRCIKNRIKLIDCDVLIFNSYEERIRDDGNELIDSYIQKGKYQIYNFKGNHFFAFEEDNIKRIIDIIGVNIKNEKRRIV